MIVLVDYKAGNLTSVQLALAEAGYASVISSDPAVISAAERLVFPGVGAAGSAMEELNRLRLGPVLKDFIAGGKPFLGICVGCQIIMDWSLEDGKTPCLGLIPGGTDIFAAGPGTKVPHMGWNQVRFAKPHPLFAGIPDGSEFYYVHSYYPTPARREDVLAETEYGGVRFAAILGRGNLAACQFHVEKSGKHGLRLLRNFCQWDGSPTWDGRASADGGA
jgi:imidazole glycerol-phosphate synthase subunit HisH